MDGSIIIKSARVNNLKNISLEIPRGKFVVVTGISGSGKSSLAFDTLYAEGQRRFAESISSYARQFLGRMNKPDVDLIDGIPPAIAIEQKVSVKNPRSTVATTTEIYDFLRLVFARIGRTYSPVSGEEVHSDTAADVMKWLGENTPETLYILADIGWDARQDKVETLLTLKEDGYSRLYLDGRALDIEDVLQMGENAPGGLMLLIDRLKVSDARSYAADKDLRTRLLSSVNDAFSRSNGTIVLEGLKASAGAGPADAIASRGCNGRGPLAGGVSQRQAEAGPAPADVPFRKTFCSRFERDGISFRKPDEYLFSFNSPLGACPVCGGLGKIIGISEDLVIPDKTKSIYDGAIACWRGEKMGWFKDQLILNAEVQGIPVFEPYCKLTKEQKDIIWTHEGDYQDPGAFFGLNQFFKWVESNRYKIQYKYMLSRYSGRTTCHSCGGSRLRPEALYVKICGKTIHDLMTMTVEDLLAWFKQMADTDRPSLTDYELQVAGKTIDEIKYRLQCIEDVGLGYLTLSRTMNTLSGGESQRMKLAAELFRKATGNTLYMLDEPTTGLHFEDIKTLLDVLQKLVDQGNTVIIIEHNPDILKSVDYLIDMGPEGGRRGGTVVSRGTPEQVASDPSSVTGPYLKDILR